MRRRNALVELAAARDWQLVGTYRDTEGTRPELRRLQADIMAGNVHWLMPTSRTWGATCSR